jgi:hypothetical protein
MIIPRQEDLRGLKGAPKGSIKDTKRAVVFATLGLPLDPVSGILVMRLSSQDRLDGDAYFTFDVPLDHWERVNRVYSAEKADLELDAMLERLKTNPAFAAIGTELEQMIVNALIVYGRRFLENYQRMTKCLQSKGRDIEIKEKKGGAFEFKFYLARNNEFTR